MKEKTSKEYKRGYRDACNDIIYLIKRRTELHQTGIYGRDGDPTAHDVLIDIYELAGTKFIDEYEDEMFPEE